MNLLEKIIILHYNTILNDDQRKKLEDEYSEQLNANVVILDARFDKNIVEL